VYRNSSMIYRTSSKLKIASILFSTFFGWWDPSWATPVDTNIIFKDFEISY